MGQKPIISIVSPIYRAEKIVDELVHQLTDAMHEMGLTYEIILVDDRSPDNSWVKIHQICQRDSGVKGIRLSRNFGQHYAITAGLSLVQGEWIIVMDCDLQDRPDQIRKLYETAQDNGAKVVFARREHRRDGFFKRLSSKLFHALFSYMSGVKSDETVANFGIYHRDVIAQYNHLKEQARSFTSLVKILGYQTDYADVLHAERFEGKSSYTFAKLIRLTLDVTISNTNKPLHLTTKLGFLMSFFSILLAFYNLLAHAFGIITVQGFTSTMFSIWFVGGLIVFILGILGLYIGKIFDQVKARPLFIIEEQLNCDLE